MRDGGGVCDVHRVVVEVGECGGFLTKNKQKRGGVSCVMCVYMTGRTGSGTERHVDVNESVWIRTLGGQQEQGEEVLDPTMIAGSAMFDKFIEAWNEYLRIDMTSGNVTR